LHWGRAQNIFTQSDEQFLNFGLVEIKDAWISGFQKKTVAK
jgi:hypothetical protein